MEANRVYLEVVDTETGEIKKVGSIKRRNKKPRYFWSNHEGSKMFAKLNMSKNEYRVLFMLQSKIGYNNLLFINKTKMADEFKCDRVMLSKTISMLEKRGIIQKAGSGYRFSNDYIKCGE